MLPNDGGQAFPVPAANFTGGQLWSVELGMTLRDYFAGQAAAVLWQINWLNRAMDDAECELQIANVAVLSYRIADAMLKARQ